MTHTNPVIGSTGWGTVLNDALDDIQTDADAAQTTADDHIADAAAAHAASAIEFTPVGTIAATTVAAAIAEVATDAIAREAVITAAAGQAPTATTVQLEDVAHAINTANKVAGKSVFNTTTGAPVWAVDTAAADVWNDATGTLAHTPV